MNQAKKKIAFFLGDFQGNGGISRVVSVLANELCKRYDIYCICYFDRGLPQFYELDDRIHVSYWLIKQTSMTKAILSGKIKKLKKYLKEKQIDIAVGCGTSYSFILSLACKKLRTKCICWDHTSPYQSSDFKFNKLVNIFSIKQSDINVFLTKEAKDYYDLRVNSNKNFFIYNPIDIKASRSKGYNYLSKRIISVGRICYQKNFECLVEIANDVLKKHTDWSWDVYGSGDNGILEKLIRRSTELNLTGQLNFKGQISNIYDKYSDYSFLVMTSRYEGFPMVLLEGTANLLPLVSFDIHTGPREIINENNGFLVPFEDRFLMSQCIERLINDQCLRTNMSNNQQKKCCFFSLENILNQWEELFTRLTDV